MAGYGSFLWFFCVFNACQGLSVEEVIESCLLKILNTYFVNESILMVSDLTVRDNSTRRTLLPQLERKHHDDMISTIMHKEKWPFQIYNSRKYIGLPEILKLNKLKNTIIFLRNETTISDNLLDHELELLLKNPLWNPAGRNLFLVRVSDFLYNNKGLTQKIIKKLWTRSKASDNLVMIVDPEGVIRFFTWFPYRQPYCSKVQNIMYLDSYSSYGFRWRSNLFPVKMEGNLHGCDLLAATDSCTPYVFSDPDNATKFVGGLEYLIAESFSQQLNFELRTVRPPNLWATTVNGSLAGAFKLLVEQKVDFAFSCLMLNKERNLLALALPPYHEDALSWFVPVPGYKSHATDIFYSLPFDFWLLMVITFLVSVVPVILLSYVEHGRKKLELNSIVEYFLKLIDVALYGPSEFRTKKWMLKFFIFLYSLYSMHITVSFQSSLFALYRKPHYDRFYSSLKETIDDGLFVYLRPSTQELYNQSDHVLWNKILTPGRFDYLHDFGEAFSQIAYDKDAIALFIRSTGIYMITVYFTEESGLPQIVWLREKFAVYPVTMYLSPNNALFPLFQIRIYRLLDSGLIRRWLYQSIVGGKIVWFSDSFRNSPLSLGHLIGAFFALLLLQTVAVLIFIAEIIVFNAKKKANKNSELVFSKKHESRNLFPTRMPKTNPVRIRTRAFFQD